MKINGREIQSDLIRVIAMLFVICVHVHTNLGERHWFLDGLRVAMILTCNGMFFMLSGKYNLRFQAEKEQNSYGSFYQKKLTSIVIPFVIYTLVVYICNMQWENWSLSVAIQDYFRVFFDRNITTHLWFMYQLIGILLSAPFLAVMLHNLSDKSLILLLSIGFGWNFVSITLLPDILGYTFNFSGWILSEMLLYFVLGYALDRIIKKKEHVMALCGLGILGVIITIVQGHFFEDKFTGLYDLSLVYIFVNIGLYLFLERICLIKSENFARVLSFIAKHSFGVYILHFYVIQWLGNNLHFPWVKLEIASYLLSVLTVFVLSFAASFFLDTVIINPLQKLFREK